MALRKFIIERGITGRDVTASAIWVGSRSEQEGGDCDLRSENTAIVLLLAARAAFWPLLLAAVQPDPIAGDTLEPAADSRSAVAEPAALKTLSFLSGSVICSEG